MMAAWARASSNRPCRTSGRIGLLAIRCGWPRAMSSSWARRAAVSAQGRSPAVTAISVIMWKVSTISVPARGSCRGSRSRIWARSAFTWCASRSRPPWSSTPTTASSAPLTSTGSPVSRAAASAWAARAGSGTVFSGLVIHAAAMAT